MPQLSQPGSNQLSDNGVHHAGSTMNEIEKICPFIRILVLGKSGVGKSSLIKQIFFPGEDSSNTKAPTVEDFKPGKSDIDREFQSSRNPFIRLHDSEGYEAGEVAQFDRLSQFIEGRSGENVAPTKRIHLVWYCIELPMPGGRLTQTGDKRIIELCDGRVPIVVVFTKFDRLLQFTRARVQGKKRSSPEEREKAKEDAHKTTEAECQKHQTNLLRHLQKDHLRCVWVSNKKEYQTTLQNLIAETIKDMDSTSDDSNGSTLSPGVPISSRMAVVVMLVVAQCVALDLKIRKLIEVGIMEHSQILGHKGTEHERIDQFLRALLSMVLNLLRFPLAPQGLETPHLLSEGFRLKMVTLAFEVNSRKSNSTWNMDDKISRVIDSLPDAVGSWMKERIQDTPLNLRTFMAFFTDLVVVLAILFKQPRFEDFEKAQSVTERDVHQAIEAYRGPSSSNLYTFDNLDQVHREIQAFVKNQKGAVQTDMVLEKIKKLIEHNTGLGTE